MLDVKDLSVAYEKDKVLLTAVRDFSITINMGQTYGLVGESGSGKSTIAMAIMRYLSDNAQIVSGEIILDGRPLHDLPLAEMRQLWGRDLSLVPQDPMASLNPSIRVGEQLAEALRLHQGLSNGAAADRAVELLRMVRVPDPPRVARSYPHQISGGMQQRVLLAQALSSEPKLLVLDEPTTSLDVTTQAAVLDLFRELIREMHTAVLYISHNLGIVANICDQVAVLYAGELVEDSPAEMLFQKPLHPYTQALLDSVPQAGQNKSAFQLQAIPGRIPSISDRDKGCVFAPRCKYAIDLCFSDRPELESVDTSRRVRCHRWTEIAAGTIEVQSFDNEATGEIEIVEEKPILEIDSLKVEFPISRTLADAVKRNPKRTVKAVDGINMSLPHGRTLGVVGESGSGKTTLARTIIGLTERTDGDVKLFGYSLPPKLAKRDLETLRLLQYVFQNPEEALNPFITIGETLRRPFITLLGQSRAEADLNARNLLAAVRLPEEYFERLPSQLSGGEKQRIAIARAFATNPELLLADEPVSALDVSVQASILNLMNELQADNDNTMLFISHDLAVVGYLADRIAVIYAGQLVEVADASDLFSPPFHPYTEALLSAIPVMDPTTGGNAIRLDGDVPSQIDLPSGCRFHPRCPRFLGDICRYQEPPWQQSSGGKKIYCHISPEELAAEQKPFG